jgi:hypothetical protein
MFDILFYLLVIVCHFWLPLLVKSSLDDLKDFQEQDFEQLGEQGQVTYFLSLSIYNMPAF